MPMLHVRLPLLLLCLACSNLAALSVTLSDNALRCRPAKQIDLTYTLDGYSGDHSMGFSGLPSGVTATPTSGTGVGGTITFSVAAGTDASTSTIEITISTTSSGSDTASLTFDVDPAPTLVAGQTFT